jgi:integral membrane sensor domain MASE1
MSFEKLTPEILKEILQQEAGSGRPRIVAAILAVALLVVILEIVRRRKLREEFSPIWISWALGVIVAAIFYTPLVRLTQALGA